MDATRRIENFNERFKRSWPLYVGGAVLVLLLSFVLLYLIVTGKTRTTGVIPSTEATTTTVEATSTTAMVPRRLDGVMVPAGQDAFAPRGVMVDNMVDARPESGVAKANVVIESPVEGGITRLFLLFDATTTVDEVGPVRSSRPYFVDWANGWNASYFHVGGSPDALDKIKALGATFANFDEMAKGQYFWRASDRVAPHSTYTKKDLMDQALADGGFSSSTAPIAWHFRDAATSTDRGSVATVKIPYGGSYNVTWKFDKDRGVYVRWIGTHVDLDKDGAPVESDNVILIETDAKVLDEKGRLQLRTTGGGPAVAYRDGNKFVLRWSRTGNEPIRFESTDGTEFLLNRGKTWIEVTTDDRIFGGVGL